MRSVAEVTKDLEDFCETMEDFCEYNHVTIVRGTDEVIASFFETHCGMDGGEPPQSVLAVGSPPGEVQILSRQLI